MLKRKKEQKILCLLWENVCQAHGFSFSRSLSRSSEASLFLRSVCRLFSEHKKPQFAVCCLLPTLVDFVPNFHLYVIIKKLFVFL